MDQSNDLDKLLSSLLGNCFEATCEYCGVFAVGTSAYHKVIAQAALHHQEASGHHVDLRSWAEPPYEPMAEC